MTKDSHGKGDHQVFINCPFDKNYQPLLHAIIFTVHLLGFRPRCAQEIKHGGGSRLSRIIEMIFSCKYGIHDLSRIERTGHLPRFNMPFELGLDIGIKEAGKKSQNLLILETNSYRYHRFISDLKGWDVAAHHNKVPDVINKVRDWLNDVKETERPLPNGKLVHDEYEKFQQNLPEILKNSKELKGPVAKLTFTDYSFLAAEFIKTRHEKQSQ